MPVVLRPIRAEDEAFLYRVYASTREREMALVDWCEAEKEAFLRMQFEAQHTYYKAQFKEAELSVVEEDGRPIGRLYVDRRPEEIRIIDIALLPEHRKQGLGTRLLEDVLAEAYAAGKPVRIHVEKQNPAMRLYRRLGFVTLSDEGVYDLLEWSPEGLQEKTIS